MTAAARTIAAAKSRNRHRQRSKHRNQIAFSSIADSPGTGHGAAFGQLIDMPVHRFALPHVSCQARPQSSRPIGRTAIKVSSSGQFCARLAGYSYQWTQPSRSEERKLRVLMVVLHQHAHRTEASLLNANQASFPSNNQRGSLGSNHTVDPGGERIKHVSKNLCIFPA